MKKFLSTWLFFFTGFFCHAQNSDAILGKWTNEDSSIVVQVYKKGDIYTGKIVSLKDENASILLDSENNDEALRKRKVIGLDVWTDFTFLQDKGMWKNGIIYNYKTGNDYTGKIQVEGNELKLTGYYGFFFFLAKTQKWLRVK